MSGPVNTSLPSLIGRSLASNGIGGYYDFKTGKIVSKKMSQRAKASPWLAAVKQARSALKIKGFCAIKKGTPLYAKAKEFFKA